MVTHLEFAGRSFSGVINGKSFEGYLDHKGVAWVIQPSNLGTEELTAIAAAIAAR